MPHGRKKILIFGGAFNPPHVGHLLILKKAMEYIKPDDVIISVDKISPWKHVGNLAPYKYRLEMTNNLFGNEIKYQIYNNEHNYVYSCDIVKDISKNNPDADLFFLVGQDQYDLITTWNNYDVINELTTIVCYRRGKTPARHIFDKHIILSDPAFDCSSSQIRLEPTIELLGQKNYDYIVANNLYLQHKIKNYMSERRYEHTLRVLATITQIAMGNNFSDGDILKCQIAAVLHDIAKQYSDQQLREIISNDELNSFPSYHCAHGLAGARLAAKDFNITDKLILDAIDNHVIFKDVNSSNKIAKALYCADKLEPARTEQDIANREKLFKQCCQDLETTFQTVYKLNTEKY